MRVDVHPFIDHNIALSQMTDTTLLHVDPDSLLAAWLRREITFLPWIRHAGHVGNGADAIEFCRYTPPDIVLIEWILPDISCITVAVELSKLSCPPKIIVFTAFAYESTLYSIAQAAIHGIVWKTPRAIFELGTAAIEVLAGRTYFSDDTKAAFSELRQKPDAFFKILSDREIDLLRLFARGLSDQDVATQVGLSVGTARSHRQHIMAKIGVHSTPALMRWAMDRGFDQELRPSPPCELAG